MEDSGGRITQLANMKIDDKIESPIERSGFGFSRARILAVCEMPDSTSLVMLADLNVEICAKQIGDRVGLVGIAVSRDPWEALFGLVALPDLSRKPLARLTPLQILERIVKRFGLKMTIGGKSRRFFLKRVFRIPKPPGPAIPFDRLIRVHNMADRPFVGGRLGRADEVDGGVTVQIALAFCIDTIKYLRWISD